MYNIIITTPNIIKRGGGGAKLSLTTKAEISTFTI